MLYLYCEIYSGLSVLTERIESNQITICSSGSVIENHPKLSQLITEIVGRLVPNKSINFELIKNGPLIGSAIVAAMAQNQQTYNQVRLM